MRAVLGAACMCAATAAIGCGAPAPAGNSAESDDAGRDTADAFAHEPEGESAAPSEDARAPADATDANALVVVPAAFTEENAPMRMLQNGAFVDLIRAPQGGHVVLLAAQVKNMSTSAATIRVRMRRSDTGFIVAEEKRTVAMVPVPGDSGTMQPDLRSRSQVAHVPLCPDYDAIDIIAQPLDVEIEVTALYTEPPRMGSARIRLVPACRQATPEAEALCRCECEANYALGKCAGDGGSAVGALGTTVPSHGTP